MSPWNRLGTSFGPPSDSLVAAINHSVVGISDSVAATNRLIAAANHSVAATNDSLASMQFITKIDTPLLNLLEIYTNLIP